MNAYQPTGPQAVWILLTCVGLTLTVGLASIYSLPIKAARVAAWSWAIGCTVAIERLTANDPPGWRMLALILILLTSLKTVVAVESRARGQVAPTPLRWLAFATLWPGMRPALFDRLGRPGLAGAASLFRLGLVRLAAGLACLVIARGIWMYGPPAISVATARWLATAVLLPGLSLVLHFGIFNLLAAAWRLAGVDCRPLFRAPLAAKSLTEFWGRRWNLAFSEMTAIAIYRPLVGRLGKGGATTLAFLFSGLLHELAISVPVKAGYGLPFLYFALHAALMLVEHQCKLRGRPLETWGWPAHAWTIAWLAIPLPILFHPAFLRGIVWPLIGMEG